MNLEQLHNRYLQLKEELQANRSRCPYMIWERQWYEWAKAGFTMEDLELVMRWVAWNNKVKDYKYSATIQAILDLEKFCAWLELATGWEEMRKKPKHDPNKVSVLAATFRQPEEKPVRPIGDVFKAMRQASE